MAAHNPFRPGRPVAPGMFAGRANELETIDGILLQTGAGNAQCFLITGERGIGKSSLLLSTRAVAEGRVPTLGGQRVTLFTVSVSVKHQESQSVIASRILDRIKRETEKRPAIMKTLKGIEAVVTRIEIAGSRLHPAQQIVAASSAASDLVDFLTEASRSLDTEYGGICVLIDEADNSGAELGRLLKDTIDGLAANEIDNVCFGVAGLPELLQKMRDGHESSTRLFAVLPLEPLEEDERKQVVTLGLEQAASHGGTSQIDEAALDLIAELSDGYPHFIQQYAYSAYEVDVNGTIDITDVFEGATKENGALDQLGAAVFSTQVFKQIRTPAYREVLSAMAAQPEKWVTKQSIREATGLKDTTLTNALSAMANKHIILRHPEKNGHYCLPTQSLAIWIRAKLKTQRDAESQHL